MVPLPATPANLGAPASLAYRFNVGASVNLYRQAVATGSVSAYATVATTSDVAGHPIDFNNYASSDFAIFASLPSPKVPPILSGTISQIEGSRPSKLSDGSDPFCFKGDDNLQPTNWQTARQ